jgi:hypothetical protein
MGLGLMVGNRYTYRTINGRKLPIHKHVMEEKLGRRLLPEEHVYHLDGDPKNNDIDNLIIIKKKSWSPKK